MNSRHSETRTRAIENFRFFDDLHPAVREAVRECAYDVKLNEIMSKQHEFYQHGRPLEELAEDIRRRDQAVFNQRMKLPPNLRYPNKREIIFS